MIARVDLPVRGDESYPIVSLTWLLLYERYGDPQKSGALKRFVTWGLSLGGSGRWG